MRTALLVAVAALSGCSGFFCTRAQTSQPLPLAWPEADALFTGDARFLGADSAYSVSLGDDRVLWLFGDTFVALDDARSRRHAKMVRNSIAVEAGLDPAKATIRFLQGGTDQVPSSFFSEPGSTDESKAWRWPGTPALVDGKLLLFFWDMKASETPGAFGFTLDHTSAVVVDNPLDDPSTWRAHDVPLPALSALPGGGGHGIALGTGAAFVDGDVVRFLAAREPGDHEMFAAHVSVHDAAHGDLSHLVVDGDAGFTGATELSLSKSGDTYVVVVADGFGAAHVDMRTAPSPAGPWSAPTLVYAPPEGAKPNALVYSAKAHPELTAPHGELVATYCTNNTDLGTLVDDMSIYFPRFVRVVPSPR